MPKPRKLSRAQLAAALQQLYRQVPDVNCRGRCWDGCTEFEIPRLERRLITEATGVEISRNPPPAGSTIPRARCRLLTEFGQCGAYDIRPLICRIWGASEIAPCNYGCRPQPGQRLLTISEAYALLAAAYLLSGQDRTAAHYQTVARLPAQKLATMAPAMKAYVWGLSSRQETAQRVRGIRQARG